MLQSLLDLLQQIDLSALGDLSELDWTNIATYGALTVAFAGIVWTTAKNFLKVLWQKTEGLIGFTVSTLVVISLWYTLLRVHVSISFNLDKEVFDNLLWFSAILFTPYYLIHYNLLMGFLVTVVRTLELVLDLLIFSWFPKKAEQNREKWKNRIGGLSHTWKDAVGFLLRKEPALVPTGEVSSNEVTTNDSNIAAMEIGSDEAAAT
ncbi:MAG: hypothetical protein AAF821_07505 [Cyanobacteria bacterium P01_D01_bin.156]